MYGRSTAAPHVRKITKIEAFWSPWKHPSFRPKQAVEEPLFERSADHLHFPNLLTHPAIGTPTITICTPNPDQILLNENGPRECSADNGNTM